MSSNSAVTSAPFGSVEADPAGTDGVSGVAVDQLPADTEARLRREGPLVLVADLDTLVAGRRSETGLLAERLRPRPHTSVVYVSASHSFKSASVCIEVFHLPPPDVIVPDGGASVRPTKDHQALGELDEWLEERWPGARPVRTRAEPLNHLFIEQRREDARRVTYFPRRDVAIEDARRSLEEALRDLDVDVLTKDGDQVDVVPRGVDIPSTVVQTLQALKVRPSWVVAAGSFLEPSLVEQYGYWGIATADTPESVRALLAGHERVHISARSGAGGVLEGLSSLGFL